MEPNNCEPNRAVSGTSSFDLGSREFGVSSLVRGAFLQEFIAGRHRYLRELSADWDSEGFESFQAFLPDGAEVVRELHQRNGAGDRSNHISVKVGDTWVYLQLNSGTFRVVATGDNDLEVKQVLENGIKRFARTTRSGAA